MSHLTVLRAPSDDCLTFVILTQVLRLAERTFFSSTGRAKVSTHRAADVQLLTLRRRRRHAAPCSSIKTQLTLGFIIHNARASRESERSVLFCSRVNSRRPPADDRRNGLTLKKRKDVVRSDFRFACCAVMKRRRQTWKKGRPVKMHRGYKTKGKECTLY